MTYRIYPDGSGAGGGTGGAGTFTPPPMAGWTWVNQTTAFRQDATDGKSFSICKPANGVNADDMALYLRPIPASRRVTVAYRYLLGGGFSTSQFPSAGIALYDSNTGKFVYSQVVFDGIGSNGPTINPQRWNSPVSFNSSYRATAQGNFLDVIWFRLYQPTGAGNRRIEWSGDGELWLPSALVDVAWNEHCTPDMIGIGVNPYGLTNNATMGAILKLMSYKEDP